MIVSKGVVKRRPFTISWVTASTPGKLGLSFAPGKNCERGGVKWERSMAEDAASIEKAGVKCVVCLLSKHEMRALGIAGYEEELRRRAIEVVELPIVEGGVHGDMEQWAAVVEYVASMLLAGGNVLAHCRGGVGRAGTLAACVLLKLGEAQDDRAAIALVRQRRCKEAVETRIQEGFIAQYHRRTQQAPPG